jgi:hypothetical protein
MARKNFKARMMDGVCHGVGAVFLIAGLLQWVEYDGAPQAEKNLCPGGPCINFWDAFYFIIVTVRVCVCVLLLYYQKSLFVLQGKLSLNESQENSSL